MNIFGVWIVLILLTAVGLTLAVWYKFVPDSDLPAKADLIFPHFVASQLPAGIAGMLMAAILAATMSSITSGINALSATFTLDFYSKIKRMLNRLIKSGSLNLRVSLLDYYQH